jgi:hypothetical protein
MSITLELEEVVKAVDEQIEVLKQNLLFLMAEHESDGQLNQKIITIKRKMDKAVQKRMKLTQILLSSP